MKCIKNVSLGLVSRETDGVAALMVAKGTHVYVSKSTWKQDRDVTIQKSRVMRRVRFKRQIRDGQMKRTSG